MKIPRGFTLIELLVVIAIIGLLSSVVLASLSSARGKGLDGRVKEQLHSLQQAAEIYYSKNATYKISGSDSVCSPAAGDTTGLIALQTGSAWPDGNVPTCRAGGSAWAADHVLSDGSFWCVDFKGTATTTPDLPAGQQYCLTP